MVNIANNQPIDDLAPPSELAETYVSAPRFNDADAVLRGSRFTAQSFRVSETNLVTSLPILVGTGDCV